MRKNVTAPLISAEQPATSPSLSERLSRTVPDGFFRPLVSRLAPVYVDCASLLEMEAGEAAKLELSNARALVQEVVFSHTRFGWPEKTDTSDIRARAGQVFNDLLAAYWLEERPESLHERWIVISPVLRPLLNMLRELAADSIGELKTFADTLEGVCRTLETPEILDLKRSGDDLRSTVSDLNTRLAHAIAQLHSVEKIIHTFEQRQMHTRTGAETLQLFYADFYEGSHMVCHDVLHRRGLLSRIHQAREIVRVAAESPFVQEKLTEALVREHSLTKENGWQRAGEELTRLARALMGIRQRADAVDARIASFHQLSRQRFHYQSEMRGRRPELARRLCEVINQSFAGQRFSDLDGSVFDELVRPWRGLLVPEVEILHGAASLRNPRRSRQPVSLELSDAKMEAPDDAELARLREQMRIALTPTRAARLVLRVLPHAGSATSTREITLVSESDLLDLMATASFAQAPTTGGILNWEVTSSHQAEDVERKDVPHDPIAGWQVERFTLTRRS